MNAIRSTSAVPRSAAFIASPSSETAARAPSPAHDDPQARHVHRSRDFGVGYGSSSGYGSALHFIDGHVDPPFRFR